MADPTITVTAHQVPDNTPQQITLTKTGAHAANAKVSVGTFGLTEFKASADGLKFSCKGPFSTSVTCTIQPSAAPANSNLTVDVSTFVPFISGTYHFQLGATDEQKLVPFLKTNFHP
jgi:hypothetical protein